MIARLAALVCATIALALDEPITFAPAGELPRSLQARALDQVFVGDYGAGGSGNEWTTTGPLSAGSTSLTFTTTSDFACAPNIPCQGLLIPGAGAAFSAAPPTARASVVGTAGSTTYTYAIASIDAAGGVGVPVTTSVTTGNASLSAANYVSIAITLGANAKAYTIWKKIGTGAYVWLGADSVTTYADTGLQSHDGHPSGMGPWRPWWMPATPPTSAQNDWLIAQLTSVNGATLAFTPATISATSGAVTVWHDDTAAINAALATGKLARIPCGNYPISSTLVVPNYAVLRGDGQCTKIFANGASDIFSLPGVYGPGIYGAALDNMYVDGIGYTAFGHAVNASDPRAFDISNVIFDHVHDGIYLLNGNDIRLAHIRVDDVWGQQGSLLALRSDATNELCCVDGIDVYGYMAGGGYGDGGRGQVGYLIDGNVQTIIARNFGVSDPSGAGLKVSNAVGNASTPQFIQFSDFACEFANGRCVDLEAGSLIDFEKIYLHAGGYNNFVSCSSTTNFYVANGVTEWSVIGGRISNAIGDNVYVAGQEGTLSPAHIVWGSLNAGGAPGQCPAVEFGATASGVILTGANIGDLLYPTSQAEPALLDSGATKITVKSNTCIGNALEQVVDNSGSATNVIGPNAGCAAQTYTVATVPTCNAAVAGAGPYLTSVAASPTWNGTLTAGTATTVFAYCNGRNWIAR